MHENDPDEATATPTRDEPEPRTERDEPVAPTHPARDAMGEPSADAPDIMGTRQPRADEALGDDPERIEP